MDTDKKVVEEVGFDEGMAALQAGLNGLHGASRSQLRASLLGIAEAFIERTIECSERTKHALVMEVVTQTLADNRNPEIELSATCH